MRSTFFKSLFLTSSALCVLVAPSFAQEAEPELYFTPSSAWEVSKNEAMCSVGTTFNNGFIMRFAGDELWVDALDINFKQDIFDADRAYDVSLSVPGVSSKTFKANPASSRTLSIGLRKQKEFYQDIRDSSVLDLNVDGNEFRFYMTGFGATAEKFERCMAGAVVKDERVAADALAERSEERNFMVNESIAMEEKAKAASEEALQVSSSDLASDESLNAVVDSSDLVEITDETDAPVIQEIGVKETRKVGDITVGVEDTRTPEAIAPEPVLSTESALAEGVEDAPSTPTSEAILAVEDDAPALAEMTENTAESEGEQRLSEQLAEAVNENPDWVQSDKDKAYSEMARRQLEIPEEIQEMPLMAEETASESIEPIMEAPEVVETAPPSEEELAIVDVEPSDAVAPQDEAEAIVAETPEASEPVMEEKAPETLAFEPPPAKVENVRTPPVKVETQKFSGEADFSQGVQRRDLDEMRKQIVRMESTIDSLKAENTALNKELNTSLRESEQERLEIASENWNLEQATMKFNEAERQIKRLGADLQKERARCAAETKELEALLFDPQVTNEAQLARLAQLEAELAEARLELQKERSRFEQQMQKSWTAGSQ